MGRPKQFIELLGMPALHYTLRAFEESPEVARIYAVGDRQRIENLAQAAGITKYAACAEPGEARSFSTRNGLLLCEEDPETIVLVHDGSRCLVTPELIRRVVRAADGASEPDGVIPGVPVSDTIKVAREGTVAETAGQDEPVGDPDAPGVPPRPAAPSPRLVRRVPPCRDR